jgi:hypothetical protein
MQSHSDMLENVLVRAKDRKSSKKCREGKCELPKPKPCDVDCCIPDCNPDCCTPAFQRLDKLRQVWQLTQYSPTLGSAVFVPAAGTVAAFVQTSSVPELVFNRAGQSIVTPTVSPYMLTVLGSLERAAYAFVNEVRYLNFEECGKLDQVTGWSVDVQSGDLYFYQNLPELGLAGMIAGVSTSGRGDSREHYLKINSADFTPQDKQKLAAIEPFWKLSLKAIERVRENPKTEGNVCEVKDKCGNRFLVAVNRADGQSATSSVCEYNSRYSIVAVKLC